MDLPINVSRATPPKGVLALLECRFSLISRFSLAGLLITLNVSVSQSNVSRIFYGVDKSLDLMSETRRFDVQAITFLFVAGHV